MKNLFQQTFLALALGATLIAFVPVAQAQHQSAPTSSKIANKGRYRDVRGQVVSTSRTGGQPTLTVAHERIPGFMRAMTMTLLLHNPRDAARLKAGSKIRFDMLKMGGNYHIANIRPLSRNTRLKLAR